MKKSVVFDFDVLLWVLVGAFYSLTLLSMMAVIGYIIYLIIKEKK